MSKDYLKKARKIVDSKMTGELVGTLARLLCRIDELCRIDDLEKCQEVHTYLCTECGKPRTKDEGGTTFTVCDECWEKAYVKLREDLRKAAASQGSSIVSVRELEATIKEHETLGLQVYGRKIQVLNDRVKELEAENARYKRALQKIANMERYTFAECTDAEFIISTAKNALGKEVEDNGDTKQARSGEGF